VVDHPPPVVALLVAILTDVEALPGALCAGQAPRFDADALDGEAVAVQRTGTLVLR
jgi:hypothetical protein